MTDLAYACGLGRLFLASDGEDGAEFVVRPRNDLHADDFADPAGCGGAGIDGRFHRGHVADHQGGHQTAADLLPAEQRHVRRLDHGVAGLNQRHQALRLDHAEGFHVTRSHYSSPKRKKSVASSQESVASTMLYSSLLTPPY